jgi:diphthamide biosynthesis enzyme Dph1/Dph2-like protein
MESTMIANSNYKFYQYDPYSKKFTIEEYDTPLMLKNRQNVPF